MWRDIIWCLQSVFNVIILKFWSLLIILRFKWKSFGLPWSESYNYEVKKCGHLKKSKLMQFSICQRSIQVLFFGTHFRERKIFFWTFLNCIKSSILRIFRFILLSMMFYWTAYMLYFDMELLYNVLCKVILYNSIFLWKGHFLCIWNSWKHPFCIVEFCEGAVFSKPNFVKGLFLRNKILWKCLFFDAEFPEGAAERPQISSGSIPACIITLF